MGWLGRLFGVQKKGRWKTIRANYRTLDPETWTDDEHDHFWATCTDEEYWAEWDRWSFDTFEHPTLRKVRRSVLDLALQAAQASHPLEFAGLLRLKGDTITELVLLPGTIQGDSHAIFQMHMLPVDRTINGTVHSHPDPHPYPSDADFELFDKHGAIHLILCEPYGPEDWRCYDHMGTPTFVEVVR